HEFIQAIATCFSSACGVGDDSHRDIFAPPSGAVGFYLLDLRVVPLFCGRNSAVNDDAFCFHRMCSPSPLLFCASSITVLDAATPAVLFARLSELNGAGTFDARAACIAHAGPLPGG